jgi:hypothetical protein
MQVVAFRAASAPASSTSPSSTAPATTGTPTPSPTSATPAATPTLTTSSATPTSTPPSAPTTKPSTTKPTTPSSTPPGRTCASFPDASCTGVPAGQTLTIVTTDQTYGSNYNGQTISNMDFRGWVNITGSNITIKNSIFRGRAANGINHGLLNTDGTATVIMDSEFVPASPSATIDGLWTRNTSLYRVNIHGSVDGMKAGTNTLVQDSYIHDMSYFTSDPNQGGGPTHNDGVQIMAGESNVTLLHNRIDMSTTQDGNAALQSSGLNSRVENNYLDGGGCTLNFAAQVLGGATLTPIYVINNRFGRHQSFTGCTALISLKTVMTQYTGNVWDDTGQPVPAPQQHD